MCKRNYQTRRPNGMATIWIIASGPALLALFVLVTEIANLWLARIELRNAVEAGALAGAKVWGSGVDDDTSRSAARIAARDFAQANLVTGSVVTVGLNDSGSGGNAACDGDVLLGSIAAGQLNTDLSGSIAADSRGCRVHVVAQVASLWGGFGGPWHVQAAATARYDPAGPRLTQIVSIVCP